MKLFGKKKCDPSGCCGGSCGAEIMAAAEDSKGGGARVKILGSGCAKCGQLAQNTLQALERLGLEPEIDHVTDFAQIAAYGVMTTPALVVDGKVLAYGKVLNTEAVVELLRTLRKNP